MSDTKATKATKTTNSARDAAIRRFAAGAKVGGQRRPFDAADPHADADAAMTYRTNEYQRRALAHLAGLKRSSVQRVLSDLINEHVAAAIDAAERGE